MAQGDFSAVIATEDKAGTLMSSLADMQQGLGQLISRVIQASSELGKQTVAINGAATEAVGFANDQAKSTAAMASALEELAVSISHANENADETKDIAVNTESVLDHGGLVIRQTVDSIESIAAKVHVTSTNVQELNEHAQQINLIVKVIEDIAAQTNLLALNAALEAARAGEQGRGFSVVADEVRKLAERTALSTQEITETINKIQNSTEHSTESMIEGVASVDQGVGMANQAGMAMENFRSSANQIISGINDISHMLKEQAVAANLLAGNVEQVSQLADQSNQRIGDVYSSVESLNRLAEDLAQEASRFKLAG